MAQTSEAACLLQTGSAYPARLGLRPNGDSEVSILAGFKRGAFSLYFGDGPIDHFDLEGRWQRAYVEGMHYLKALDTSTVALGKTREGEGLVLRRRPLGFAEASDLDASIRSAALDLIDGIQAGRLEPIDPPSQARPIAVSDLIEMLERIARWDASAWFAHRERYLATYAPPGFLPPEAQNAILLQATVGRKDGSEFGLAPSPEYGIRSEAEFEAHARVVADLLGRRVVQSRRVLIGGGDVLRQPADRVAALLENASRVFSTDPTADGPRIDGLCAFLDRFDDPVPTRADWERYRALGLHRIVVGLESGDRAIRLIYGKTWDDAAIGRVVADAKAAGLGVSVVTLVNAGGSERFEDHEWATTALVGSLDLGPGDLVYLLDVVGVAAAEGLARLAASGITFDPRSAPTGRASALRERLAALLAPRKAKVVTFSPDKLWT